MPVHPAVVRQDAQEGSDAHLPNAVVLLSDGIVNMESAVAVQDKSRCFALVPPLGPSFICSVGNV